MSAVEKLKLIEKDYVRKDLPKFEVGDTIAMKIKVQEADKVRIHPFEGIVMRKKGGRLNCTFTVRKVSFGEGVERTFPINSPVIESIEVISKGKVRRARLYYLRKRVGKRSRVKHQQEEHSPAPVQASV